MRRTESRDGMGRGTHTALAVIVACAGLAGCGGSKDHAAASQAAPGGEPAAGAAPAAAPAAGAAPASAVSGQQIFQRCAVCHQATGLGLPGSFPPLAGSEWATAANPAASIRVVLHGLQGPVTVKGQKFANAMPPYGTNQPLSDAEVAAVLTYVRSSWGNAASAVTAEQVAAERAATATRTTMWTARDLQPLLGTGGR